MKNIRTSLALTTLFVLFAFSSSLGQSQRQTVNIPFNFTAGEKAFKAGRYVIARNQKNSDIVWSIQNKETGARTVLLTRPTYTPETQERSKLIFHRYDDLYFLSEFYSAGSNTGRELQISNREEALNKALAQQREIITLTERGR
jgi:hypothetical protein